MNNDTINKKKKCARCLSTGHAHAVVSATVRVVGKKLVSCKIDVGDVVRDRGNQDKVGAVRLKLLREG